MENKNIDIVERMQKLKKEILEKVTSERLEEINYHKIRSTDDMKEIYQSVEENVKIDIKCLGNPENKDECLFEVMIDDDGSISYEYYNYELEQVAKQLENGNMELVGKYRDIPSILEQIEDLKSKDELSLEEMETVRRVAEENDIEVDELYELDLSQELQKDEKSQEETQEEAQEEISATKQEDLRGYVKAEMETSQMIDGRETLGKRLGLEEYSKIYVVYSDKVDQVQDEEGKTSSRNNTSYALIGVRKDGTAKVLSDSEFEIDKSSGINPDDKHIRQNDDNTIEQSNDILTRYKRVHGEESIAIRRDQNGRVMTYFEPGRTREENMAVGTVIEDSHTRREYEGGTQVETRKILSRSQGTRNLDKVQDEVEDELEKDRDEILDPEQADGRNIITTDYIEMYINNATEELMKDDDIKDIFTREEVENILSDKIYLSSISSKEDLDKIKEDVKWEMSADAQMYNSHNRNNK